MKLDGLDPESLAIIGGTQFQSEECFLEKLCDRMVFLAEDGLVVAAVELKGGRNVDVSTAIEQIQNGLAVIADILESRAAKGWYPILMYSGRMTPPRVKVLRAKRVRFKGRKKAVVKRDCGTQLATIPGISMPPSR